MFPADCRDLDTMLTTSGLPRASQGRTDCSSAREPTHGNGSEDRSDVGRSGKERGEREGGAGEWRQGGRQLIMRKDATKHDEQGVSKGTIHE